MKILWFENFKKRLSEKTSNETYLKVIEGCERLSDESSEQERIHLVNKLLDNMTKNLTKEEIKDIMGFCGGNCINDAVINYGLGIKAKSKNIDEFIKNLNEAGMCGGNSKNEEDFIYVRYDTCYCEFVNGNHNKINEVYCNCSVGWLKVFFERMLEQNVEILALNTIIRGGKSCEFKIIPENISSVNF